MNRPRALALGVALPALLLSIGWFTASYRGYRAELEAQENAQRAAAEVVRAEFDNSLEDLLEEEGARPYYDFHFVSSEMSADTGVAPSPLSAAPTDARILGHYEVHPSGAVVTPHESDRARSDKVRTIVSSPSFAMVRELANGTGTGPLYQVPAVTAFQDAVARQEAHALAVQQADAERAARQRAYQRAQVRSRRNALSWDQVGRAGNISQQRTRPLNRRAQTIFDSSPRNMIRNEAPAQQRESTPRPRPRPPRPAPEPLPPELPAPEIVVGYTPMAWHDDGESFSMYRVVSHNDEAMVQGVVLDRGAIMETTLPQELARLLDDEMVPSVASFSEGERPAVRRFHASEILSDVAVAFPIEDGVPWSFVLQCLMLVALLVMTGSAAWLILRASDRAARLAEQKSAFVSAVSHELRTPLTAIRLHAEMLEADLVDPEGRPKVYAHLVAQSGRLSRLVENVLETQRLEEGRRVLRREETDLFDVVRAAIDSQARLLQDSDTSAELRGESTYANFDRAAVEQIVVNLLENAVKYAEGSAIVVTIGEGASLIVEDEGPGIPPADQESVFERFYRVDRASTRHAPGTGLGLSLVRELARAHGGDARVLPRERGCAIEVTLERGSSE